MVPFSGARVYAAALHSARILCTLTWFFVVAAPLPLPPHSTPSFSPRASPKHVGWAWSFLLLRACNALSLADSSHREIEPFFLFLFFFYLSFSLRCVVVCEHWRYYNSCVSVCLFVVLLADVGRRPTQCRPGTVRSLWLYRLRSV